MITEQAGAGRGQRILLIDGDPAVGGDIGHPFGAAGYALDAVTDPVRGLQQALAGRYDLIILELRWPQIDGREVLARLLRGLPQQAVLVLSRVADVSTKVECLELGARDYLTKPFSPAELAARCASSCAPITSGARGPDAQAWLSISPGCRPTPESGPCR